MELRPIDITEARAVVARLHRHLDPPPGAKFALSAWHEDRLVGVALVGRPPARRDDEKRDVAEVTRVATDGTPNACSFLYARAKRAAQALGYRRVKTKTLPGESGASLRAVGARFEGMTRGGSWDRENRRRASSAPTCQKLRWDL